MSNYYHHEETFKSKDFTSETLKKGSYEYCTFEVCNFEKADLAHIKFTECEFINCNLSMANISDVVFQDCQFLNCKMLGLHFEHCNTFGFSPSFKNCILNESIFYQRSLKRTFFKDCQLKHVDFAEANLTEATFENCDLLDSIFDQTILEKSDFRTSYNYIINPEINKLKKAKFSLQGLPGLLSQYEIKIM